MRLVSLIVFITLVWIMVLAVTAFLITFVAPINLALFGERYDRLVISVIQASLAIITVILFIVGLNEMKKFYLQKRLQIK